MGWGEPHTPTRPLTATRSLARAVRAYRTVRSTAAQEAMFAALDDFDSAGPGDHVDELAIEDLGEVKPGNVIHVSVAVPLSMDRFERIRRDLARHVPAGVRLIVTDPTISDVRVER